MVKKDYILAQEKKMGWSQDGTVENSKRGLVSFALGQKYMLDSTFYC